MLRSRRAELRSPTRLAGTAEALGMSPGGEIEYVPVDPMVLAVTIARTGEVPRRTTRRPATTRGCVHSINSAS